ncbi:hypothetical protein MNBD_IGNAVI01-105 [hydrothermal vent metagenome]|uniref:TIGR02117 family protein n=1 Tax=hydrothermal vent metagenome TaxID=652676 RepID=A0A3B1CTG6_9ZZZZ
MTTKIEKRKTYLKILKLLFYPILTLIVLIILYFSSAFILSRISVNSSSLPGPKPINIYIITNGLHSDIVVPIKSNIIDWSAIIKFEHIRSKDSTYKFIAFGWGDKEFYIKTPLWEDLKFYVAFQALFCLNPSAIHATFFREMFESESYIKISLSEQNYYKLVEYIQNELRFDRAGNVIQIKNLQYDDNDAFYEAEGSFTLFYTCNTWVNDALKSANQKACLWTPFEEGIFYQYGD